MLLIMEPNRMAGVTNMPPCLKKITLLGGCFFFISFFIAGFLDTKELIASFISSFFLFIVVCAIAFVVMFVFLLFKTKRAGVASYKYRIFLTSFFVVAHFFSWSLIILGAYWDRPQPAGLWFIYLCFLTLLAVLIMLVWKCDWKPQPVKLKN